MTDCKLLVTGGENMSGCAGHDGAGPSALAKQLTELFRDTVIDAARQEFQGGSVKNPVGTERLMRYWTIGPGAAKIGWGKPCDFCSCLRQLRKHVPRRMLKGLCANLHHRALGMWPGQEHRGRDRGAGCPC